MTYFKTFFAFLSLFITSQLQAQDDTDHHDEGEHGHEHHRNEIGIANSAVYFIKEEAVAYGLHAHFIHTIGESKWGVGLGFERIFDDHGHNTVGLVASYRPVDKLSLILSPGVTFEDESEEASFAMHAETAYEFELKNFHLGPVLEFAYDPEDFHLSLGLHIGIGF